ncbi:MAG: 50S ribosomal protein L7/L12 [bacterium]
MAAEKKAAAKRTTAATKPKKKTNVEAVMERLEQMTVLELADLVKGMEEKFGVTATAPVVQAAGPAEVAAADEKTEEKTEFDVTLSSVGDKKIQVIKVVRAVTDLGLREAKDLVDSAPKPIKTGVLRETAEEIKAKLEEVGATVEIR